MKLNLHGVVGVDQVQQIEEEEYEEPAPKKPAKARLPAYAAGCCTMRLRR